MNTLRVSHNIFGITSHQNFFLERAVFIKKLQFFYKNSSLKIKKSLGDGSKVFEPSPLNNFTLFFIFFSLLLFLN